MRFSNGMLSLTMALLASGFVACAGYETEGGGVEGSEAPIEGEDKTGESCGGGLPAGCIEGIVESAACSDPGLLKDQAFAICQADGLVFTVFEYEGGACGWQTTQAHYECCPPPHVDPPPPPPVDPPPPPPPAICASGSVGDGITCTSRDTLKLAAYEACTQAGFQLFDLIDEPGNCGPMEALALTYSCTGTCP